MNMERRMGVDSIGQESPRVNVTGWLIESLSPPLFLSGSFPSVSP